MKLDFDLKLDGIPVLVVEDDSVSATLLARILTQCGAEVETACDGNEALEKIALRPFQIMITDINMPGMDGLELVKRIRTNEHEMQIIGTSANRDTSCLIKAIELGFNDYILKPIEVDKLLLGVRRAFNSLNELNRLKDEQLKFQTVVECLGEGLAIKDNDYKIVYQNQALKDIFGDVEGVNCYKLFGHNEPCPECPTVKAMEDGCAHVARRKYIKGDKDLTIETTASLIKNHRGEITGSIEIIRDVTAQVINEISMRDLAFHDPLTGVANRRLFEDRLSQGLGRAKRGGAQLGLIFIDLDHFKEINDNYGHDFGDMVLKTTAERILSSCRRGVDTVSRFGGDEFCIIVENVESNALLSALAEKIRIAISEPIVFMQIELNITASIGGALYPVDGDDMMSLEMAADRAMYSSKQSGRNRCRFASELQTFSEEIPIIDKNEFLKRSLDDENLCIEIVEEFLKNLPENVRELAEALVNTNAEQICYYSHRLKGSSANLSLHRLHDISIKVENAAKSGNLMDALNLFPDLQKECQVAEKVLRESFLL